MINKLKLFQIQQLDNLPPLANTIPIKLKAHNVIKTKYLFAEENKKPESNIEINFVVPFVNRLIKI